MINPVRLREKSAVPAGEGRREDAARPSWSVGHERDRGSQRLEAFSDAVIAIVLTILSMQLLELDTQSIGRIGLARTLLADWSAFFAFFLTFLVVGQIWVTHHNMWRYIEKVDQGLLVINLFLLLSVALIPIAARLLADSMKAGGASYYRLATILYAATAFGMAIAFNFSLWWAKRRGLLCENLRPTLYRAIRNRFLLGPSIYLFAMLAGVILPWVSMVSYLGVIALYIWPGAGDLPSRRDAAGHAGAPDDGAA